MLLVVFTIGAYSGVTSFTILGILTQRIMEKVMHYLVHYHNKQIWIAQMKSWKLKSTPFSLASRDSAYLCKSEY